MRCFVLLRTEDHSECVRLAIPLDARGLDRLPQRRPRLAGWLQTVTLRGQTSCHLRHNSPGLPHRWTHNVPLGTLRQTAQSLLDFIEPFDLYGDVFMTARHHTTSVRRTCTT